MIIDCRKSDEPVLIQCAKICVAGIGLITNIALAALFVPSLTAAVGFGSLATAGAALALTAVFLVAAQRFCHWPVSEKAKNFNWDSILEYPEITDKACLEQLKRLLINANITSCKYKKILVCPYRSGTLAKLTVDDPKFGHYADKFPYNPKEVLYLFVAESPEANKELKTHSVFSSPTVRDYPGMKWGYIPYSTWSSCGLSSSTLKSLGF